MKYIQLGGHKGDSSIRGYAIVDDEDFAWLSQWNWYLKRGYAVRNVRTDGGQKQARMHRLIMQTPKGMDTDHINGDKLDNRRCNLRICTHSQNMQNGKTSVVNTSGYKGVYFYKSKGRYRAQIHIDGKLKFLGLFPTAKEAARAYNKAAKKYFGEYARLNDV